MIKPWLFRLLQSTILIAPIGVIGVLTVNVLLPTLKNPESKYYGSSIGYPARQRQAGKPIAVQTAPVDYRTLSSRLAAPGESVALREVEVRPQVSGIVQQVYVEEGQQLQKGDILIQLDPSDFEERVNIARNSLQRAQAELEAEKAAAAARRRELSNELQVAAARLEAAEARFSEVKAIAARRKSNNIAAARARLETAQKRLKEIETLVAEGAVPRFQLYDARDIYSQRQQELQNAQAGVLSDESDGYASLDFYLTRQKELDYARKRLELARETLKQEINKARLVVENRKAELHLANSHLQRTTISATTDGLVSQVNIGPGDLADAIGASNRPPLVTITKDIVFRVYVDQAQPDAVAIGDRATVRLVAYPGRSFLGDVINVNPTIESGALRASKVGVDRQYTYSAWIALEDLQMPPGLQGFAQFSKSKRSLVIPESAVTHLSAGEGMVMVADTGQAVVKQVKLGKLFDRHREVLAGLTPGERVVLNPRVLNPGDSLSSVKDSHPETSQ